MTGANILRFGPYLHKSQFDETFDDCMRLVEMTTAYIDGDGRREAKTLGRVAAVGYATESMRLTTRVLDLATWLMHERARRDGKPVEDNRIEDVRRKLSIPITNRDLTALPERLTELIGMAYAMQMRIRALDQSRLPDKKA